MTNPFSGSVSYTSRHIQAKCDNAMDPQSCNKTSDFQPCSVKLALQLSQLSILLVEVAIETTDSEHTDTAK